MKRGAAVLYCAAIVGACVAAAYRWDHATPQVRNERFTIPVAPPLRRTSDTTGFAALEAIITSNDPFRLANTPSSVAYDPSTESAPTGTTMPLQAMRPVFALKAIVGGPPWQAIVDGIPGQPSGTIVSNGMTIGKLTIRGVTRDSVVIQGPDTTWVLTFRRSS